MPDGEALFSRYDVLMKCQEVTRSSIEILKENAGELSDLLQAEKFSFAEKEGENLVVTLEDLSALPRDWFDPDVSTYVQSDDNISGFLLVHKLPSGSLRVELLSAYGPDAKKDLMYMIREATSKALENYSEDTKVILGRRDPASKALAGYFFPGVNGQPSIVGEREEG